MRKTYKLEPEPLRAIIGESPEIRKIKQIILKVAEGDFPVLIEGESGTGKELVALAIHRLSARAKGAFVPVNCGAIPESLMESELFGYKRGAFTGAFRDHEGLFRSAHGGTLFLDEIVEIPTHIQVKLLRVLQDGVVRSIGDTKSYRTDVRIISATNTRTEEALKLGKLRYDLYYRLSFVLLRLPPLRERLEDLPLLVDHFIMLFNKQFKKKIRGISPEALEVLSYHQWPGNIRELENAIGRAFALTNSDVITLADLPPELRNGRELKTKESIVSVREAEKELIQRALIETNGNKTRAARLLGIGRKTLYIKMKKYNIKI